MHYSVNVAEIDEMYDVSHMRMRDIRNRRNFCYLISFVPFSISISAEMAKPKESKKLPFRYIYDIPAIETNELANILDAYDTWEKLGAKMGLNSTTLALIRNEHLRRGSPTKELLRILGDKKVTINKLFRKLYEIEHKRAMDVIMSFVDEKYQKLYNDNRYDTATTIYSSMTTCRSEIPLYSTQENSTKLYEGKMSLQRDNGKLQPDPVNFNIHKNSYSSLRTEKKTTLSSLRSASQHTVEDTRYSDIKKEQESKIKNVSLQSNEVNIDKQYLMKKKHSHKANHNHKNISPSEDAKNMQEPNRNRICSGGEFVSLEEALPLVSIKQVSYLEILKATSNFDKANILGQGGFGTVYKGELWRNSVAVKRLMPRNSQDKISKQEMSMKQSLNELKFLNRARIDNILPLFAVSLDGEEPCLVYQYMENGSLEDRLRCKNGTPPLTWRQRSHIAMGTAKGLNYLHTSGPKPLVHGDIKSANILLDSRFEPKIGDFGLTREGPAEPYTHQKVTTVHGTQPYLPKEYLRDHHLSTKVDVFSYGVVLLEIATGERAHDKNRKERYLVDYVVQRKEEGKEANIIDNKPGVEDDCWFDKFLDMGLKCIDSNKKKRPEMVEILDDFEHFKGAMKDVRKWRKSSLDPTQQPTDMNLSPLQLQIAHHILRKEAAPGQPVNFPVVRPPPSPSENEMIGVPPAVHLVYPSEIKEPPNAINSQNKQLCPLSNAKDNSSLAVQINSTENNNCQQGDFLPGGNVAFMSNLSLPLISLLNPEVESEDLIEPSSAPCVISDTNITGKNPSAQNIVSKQNNTVISSDEDEELVSKCELSTSIHK